jgi:2-polyprenyl-3-methyl-5-hydroxy-6-metoxy-1,4-benzoquinol methylase
MANRVYGNKINLDEQSVSVFFENRVKKYNNDYPYVAVNYQDSNPSLTVDRDKAEKERILPLLKLDLEKSVLDIGCGIGRWADTLKQMVGYYHGTDFAKGLIDIAQQRFAGQANIEFQNLKAQDSKASLLNYSKPFDLIIISGLLIYLNDDDCEQVFANIAECAAANCQVYIREPIAVAERLTLNKIYSEELSSEYSAIYRTKDELMSLLETSLYPAGFQLAMEDKLFPQDLANRKETEQYFMILERSN